MTTSSRSTSSSTAKARKRIASIFTYLQEVDRVRTPPIVDLGEYEWHMRLRDVPAAASVRWGARLSAFAPPGAQFEDDLVLRVGRPVEESCPEPPPVLRGELHRGWDQPDRPARLQTVQPAVVSADASDLRALDSRREAFDRWLPEREAWAQKQRPMSLFLQLYELWTKFERESEKYQIYLGDGMLVREPGADSEASKVRHPVILQRLELRFDPTIPAFFLTESEDAPVLYAPMLRHLDVDGKTLLQLGQRFAEQGLDPLSGGELESFLQQLVHGLWKDGEYVRDRDAARAAVGPRLYRDPVIYLGHRSQDFADAIDRYLEALPGIKELPTALERIVGIEPADKPGASPHVEPLLTRPANAQQERVIRRLAETGAVLVQGPPGTGKTHTIANLIGHLLAQNKTILVTSHASKALRVVRDQVAEPLRSLCVSVLDSDDDSARQLEESITGILNYFSQTSKDDLIGEVAQLAIERRDLAERCQKLTAELERATSSEYDPLVLGRDQVPIAEVTREMIAARGQHDWLPGPVQGAEPPLSAAEVTELYGLVARIRPEDERDRDLVVPALERLPSLSEMGELTNARARNDDPAAQDTRALWRSDKQTDAKLAELSEQVTRAARLLTQAAPWTLECLEAAAKGREAARPWRDLVELIKESNSRIPPRMKLVLEHAPQVQSDLPLAEQISVCGEIVAHLASGKKLGRTLGVFRPAWQAFVKGATVKGKPAETGEHFQAILDSLEIRAAREALSRQWVWLMLPLGAPPVAQLGAAVEKGAQPYVEIIESALAWEVEHLRPSETALQQAGLDLPTILERSPVPSVRHGRWMQLRALYGETLPALLESRRRWLTWSRLTAEREKWLAHLVELQAAGAGEHDPKLALVAELVRAIHTNARDLYARAFGRAEKLAGLLPAIARRDALLARIEKAAPAWTRALRERTPPHDAGVPGAKDAEAAWSYRLWAQVLEGATAADIDALQGKLNDATSALHELTARYVEKLAWAAQFERTGLEQQQALAGWLALHKKIGKGSGKNAARLKEEAKRTLVKCRPAVPVWIMPLARVVESFDLATTRFDVVILDEASQCDILGLPVFAMAKEVAVVGDHEQVSPYAVGHELDKVQALIDELLEDIPNKQLYDGKTSVYDLARQSFGGTIRLLEHFRCVPEIIEFSNQLCYGGEIRPLREAGTARVKPALVAHRVPRGVKEDKVNEEEARELAALVTAVCEAPEYEGCSMGVISMVGTEQAVVIDAMLRRNLPAAEYQRRRLLCGNASQFQGDERDVVFLSMVDSSVPGKRLPVSRRDETRKVFNVAASRARDQLWVVHSLDPDQDLKDGDLRLALLSYARNPQAAEGAGAAGGMKRKPPSEFSRALAEGLRVRGFVPVLQWPIGNYVLDIAIEGAGGHRVAVQCDGGSEETAATRALAVERQMTLERIGWRFVRVRASAFALRPVETLEGITRRLRELGVQPGAAAAAGGAGGLTMAPRAERGERGDSLKQRILARTAQLRGGSRATLRAVSNAEG